MLEKTISPPFQFDHLPTQVAKILYSLKEIRLDISVVPKSVQVPENRIHVQKSGRTNPGTARKSESVLEPELETPKTLGQFKNLENLFDVSARPLRNLYFDMCFRQKLVINRRRKKNILFGEYDS